jgi:chromosome segregation ATPase
MMSNLKAFAENSSFAKQKFDSLCAQIEEMGGAASYMQAEMKSMVKKYTEELNAITAKSEQDALTIQELTETLADSKASQQASDQQLGQLDEMVNLHQQLQGELSVLQADAATLQEETTSLRQQLHDKDVNHSESLAQLKGSIAASQAETVEAYEAKLTEVRFSAAASLEAKEQSVRQAAEATVLQQQFAATIIQDEQKDRITLLEEEAVQLRTKVSELTAAAAQGLAHEGKLARVKTELHAEQDARLELFQRLAELEKHSSSLEAQLQVRVDGVYSATSVTVPENYWGNTLPSGSTTDSKTVLQHDSVYGPVYHNAETHQTTLQEPTDGVPVPQNSRFLAAKLRETQTLLKVVVDQFKREKDGYEAKLKLLSTPADAADE